MYTLEQFIALKHMLGAIFNRMDIQKPKLDNNKLVIHYRENISTPKGKDKKCNIPDWINSTDLYRLYVWTEMIRAGYILKEINEEGDAIIYKPDGTSYQMTEFTCTCPAFNLGYNPKCKHILFREGEHLYNNRKLNIK